MDNMEEDFIEVVVNAEGGKTYAQEFADGSAVSIVSGRGYTGIARVDPLDQVEDIMLTDEQLRWIQSLELPYHAEGFE